MGLGASTAGPSQVVLEEGVGTAPVPEGRSRQGDRSETVGEAAPAGRGRRRGGPGFDRKRSLISSAFRSSNGHLTREFSGSPW